HAEQNFLGVDIGLNARIAEGTGEDGVVITRQHREAIRRNGHAIAEIAVGTPVEFANPTSAPEAWIALRACGMTSRPIPSPGMTAMRFLGGFCGSTAENLTQG